MANLARDLVIAAGLAVGDGQEGLPDLGLEQCAGEASGTSKNLRSPGKYSASCRSADKPGVARISTSGPRPTRRALSFSHRIAARLAIIGDQLE
jgi:hypothetical protein